MDPGLHPTSCCVRRPREGNTRFAIVYYTTSQTDYQGARRPRQYLFVNKVRAAELGQKVAFHVDASRIARLPLTTDYFPELGRNALPVTARDPDFVAKVENRMKELIAAGFEIAKVDAVIATTK
jgi:hypothetical protein